MPPALSPSEALHRWVMVGDLRPAENGLINRTWILHQDGEPTAVLQWVNPIFSPLVTTDIDQVSRWLHHRGLVSPLPRPLPGGELGLTDPEAGHWRLLDYIPGRTRHTIDGPSTAYAAGSLVGRFHAAMAEWPGHFQAPPRNVHDTPARMAELVKAVDEQHQHPLADQVGPLAEAILADWAAWKGALQAPLHPCHGDLKISNLHFDPEDERGICLLDLDTLGLLSYSVEMGDAWRSWCNPAGESNPEATRFDLGLFEASASGWRSTAPELPREELDTLVPGIERICLELSARFARDALLNQYFREDRHAYPQVGTHNLTRARAQHALARSARAQAGYCERLLRSADD